METINLNDLVGADGMGEITLKDNQTVLVNCYDEEKFNSMWIGDKPPRYIIHQSDTGRPNCKFCNRPIPKMSPELRKMS